MKDTQLILAENERTAGAARIKRATDAAHRAVEKLDEQSLRELERIYRQAAGDIGERIRMHAGPDENLGLAELRSALAQVEARLEELGRTRDALLDVTLRQGAELGVRPYASAGAGVAVANDAGMRVAHSALDFVRTFVAEDGLQLSDRIWRLDRGARDAVVNAIEQAVIQGHGASQAALELLGRGQQVPADIAQKIDYANARAISRSVDGALMKGEGNPLSNAQKLFRTELNRAHGEAFMKGGEDTLGFVGWRYLLSPAHPRPDICDLLSTQNLYGLGKGVYPTREKTPWPAHPNTLSFIEMVFEDEITRADRDGKETSMQALERLNPAQRLGVLGQNKNQAWKDGKLTQGMIRAPWKAVKLRIGAVKIATPLTRETRTRIDRVAAVPAALQVLKDKFARVVRLPGAKVEQLQSIGKGMGAVLDRFAIRVGELGWIRGGAHRANAMYSHYVFGHQPGVNDDMRFSKAYASQAVDKAERARLAFAESRKLELARLEAAIAAAPPERSRTILEGKLEVTKAAKRWSVSSEAADPLFATAAHESGHAVYYFNRAVEQAWLDELVAQRVTALDRVKVSKYGATKTEELFAEVTALIADGKRGQVPEKILKAYEAAIAKVK